MKMYCNYVIKFIFIISFETLDYKELVYSIFSLPLTHIAMNFEVNINIRAYPDFLFISRKKKIREEKRDIKFVLAVIIFPLSALSVSCKIGDPNPIPLYSSCMFYTKRGKRIKRKKMY